jgi:hypothetical protein
LRLGPAVDESVVVATFLRGELDSARFGPEVRAALARAGEGEALVRAPDLADSSANHRRRAVLFDYRGDYLGANLDGLRWRRAELRPAEALAIRYIAWDYWLELSGGTRLPTVAAERLRAQGDDPESGGEKPPLIVVRASPSSHLMVVEGHGRLTTYAMQPSRMPNPLEVLLGEGASIRAWSLY